ncbi:IS1182 family transposase [Streptomyces globisporus]|uniref:IS1182 family transposase n=1 Tax=Streptomyces globisporus TaxID=1908 RepID=UPI001F3F5BFC|nr:IS1182 family transposase [Streptomyces globisporus]
MPELTARTARASNPRGTTAMWVRDHLDGLWSDEDFLSWYPRDGRPGLSPAQLATVCVLQFLLNLSDRQAVEAVRCRIDFKYALAMNLDDPGFHHSVLTDFRDRLSQDDRADQLLSLALDRLREAGMIKERGRQRTDSTQVLAAARELTRLELVLEAVRAALEEASRDTPHVLDDLVDAEWATRYGRPVRLPSQPSHPVTRLKQAGADARQLLQNLPPHRRGPRAKALRQIMVQSFLVDARGLLRPRTEKDGRPKGAVRIISPYDLDARRAIRGNTRWNGYLVHVTETCDANARVNLITDIATSSPIRDTQALPGIHTRLRDRQLLPAQHSVDGGYISTALLNNSARDHRFQLVGPVKASGAWQKKEQTGFTRDDFTIDFDRHQVTCPNSQTSTTWLEAPSTAPYTAARFASSQCDPCPDRPTCTRGKSARTVNFLPRHLHELQASNRTDQQDPHWKRLYATRSGVEGTICELANAHRARRSRYHGHGKTHVQHILTGIAINIERLASRAHPHRPRGLTAFQLYLDSRDLAWECWWRQGK